MEIDEILPNFDAIVGNFPYIRQELIENRISGYKEKISGVLREDWLNDYPEFFQTKKDPNLSSQADIYAYLFFHASRFLNENGGRMGIITSNSWLDAAYGFELQKFFLKNFKLVAILESRCEPWFEDAAVNTIVTIIERVPLSQKAELAENMVKFVKIKKPLKELIPWDMKVDSSKRWAGLDKLVHKIEMAGKDYLKIKNHKVNNVLKGIQTEESDDFRIRFIKQAELLKDLEYQGKTVKWGKLLRAPDVYFKVCELLKDKLIPLNQLADIQRGETTGINEFFYLNAEKLNLWNIEEEFVTPVMKSPKDFKQILANPKKLKNFIFLCNKTKTQLKKENKNGALAYIHWGEKQVTKTRKGKGGGVKFPDAPTVKNRKNWYTLPDHGLTKIFWTKSYDATFLQRFSNSGIYSDQRVYKINPLPSVSEKLLASVINSTIFFLEIEINGRTGLGEGALDTTVDEVKNYIYCPNINKINKEKSKQIIKQFNSIIKRPIKPIFEEIRLKDRINFDKIILDAFGISSEEYLESIYKGLCELVNERLMLASLRKTSKKSKVIKDTNKLIEQVEESILKNGLRAFPAEFIEIKYLKKNSEISIPAGQLKMGEYFFGKQQIITDEGFQYEARSPEEAKFIIYSQIPDLYLVKIPKELLAIEKAIQQYEKYIKNLKDKLFEAFFQRSHQHKLSDGLTNRVLEEHGVRVDIISV